MDSEFKKTDMHTRREFIGHAAKAFLGVGAIPVLSNHLSASQSPFNLNTGSAQAVIYVYLSGGMSHVDTFDTKPGTEVQGPVESINTSADGIQVSQYFPLLANQMHHFAIVNSLNSTQGAHAQGQYYMHTSYFVRGTIQHPHMGAWSSHFLGKQNRLLPSNVKIGSGSGSLGAGFLESDMQQFPLATPMKVYKIV